MRNDLPWIEFRRAELEFLIVQTENIEKIAIERAERYGCEDRGHNRLMGRRKRALSCEVCSFVAGVALKRGKGTSSLALPRFEGEAIKMTLVTI